MIDRYATYATIVVVLSLGLITAVPPLIPERIVEPFSEFGVLGPYMMLGDYPTELSVGEMFDLYLYNGNEEGRLMYYRVMVKVGSQEVNVSDTIPYSAPLLRSYELVLSDGQNMTTPISLSFEEAGINRRLVFELYKYDDALDDFFYSGEWLQMWVNVTSG